MSLMMDRAKPNVERSQLGFIDVIVQPLWATLSEVAGSELNVCLRHLQTNRQYWLDRVPPGPVTPRTRGRPSQGNPSIGPQQHQQETQQPPAVHEAPVATFVVPMS